jgi:glycine dehydrogenase subunit 1
MTFSHPYMANAVEAIKREMLAAIGANDIASLFEQIPPAHRRSSPPALPPALRSEAELRRHLTRMLSKNQHCEDNLSFLGGGCWPHHVPAICDEIVGRSEFLTPVWGTPSSDHGRNQAWFEFTSQLGELLDMEFVGLPVYSWGCAAGHAIRMAARLTGRRQVLVPAQIDPERLSVIRNYCEPPEMASHIELVIVRNDPSTGLVDQADLAAKLSVRTAAVYVESPSFLGLIESGLAEIGRAAHAAGAEFIVGTDPVALGVLAPPAAFGADIAVGPTQPLGVHMLCGGGVGGFIASRDEERYAREYPTLMIGLTGTRLPGERSFGMSLMHQSSYGSREEGKDWTGNSVYLWAIANAVYMSVLGPEGFRELGELILARGAYARAVLAELPGVEIVHRGHHFKEFALRYRKHSVAEVNRALREDYAIFGGQDLSSDFPELGQASLTCVTEVHTREDIDRLADALAKVTR